MSCDGTRIAASASSRVHGTKRNFVDDSASELESDSIEGVGDGLRDTTVQDDDVEACLA